jgi:transposase
MKDNNTKKLRRISEKTLLVTVDMGKVKHTGYCRCPDGTEIKPFDFANNRKGFEQFWQRVCEMKERHHLHEVVVGFESTGPYAEPLLHYLKDRGVRLVQVNPFHTKRLKELRGNSPGKTDDKDPKVIADIIELGHALSVIIPEGRYAELRRLTQARERGMQRLTALCNQLRDLVFVIFPEFLDVMKGVSGRSARYLLIHCPRPEDIVREGVDGLTETLKKVSRGKLGSERAYELYEAALDSVGIREGQESIVFEIAHTILNIDACERFIGNIEKEMVNQLRCIPYSRCILSIKGIGMVTAAGLIGEVGDFRKFSTISEIMKHAGLDLYEISSGKRRGKRHISKRGRPLLRKLLFYGALNTVRKGGVMEGYYLNYRKRMHRQKALVAVARKLLGIIFALIRDDSMYRESYSQRHYMLEVA